MTVLISHHNDQLYKSDAHIIKHEEIINYQLLTGEDRRIPCGLKGLTLFSI